MKILDYGCGSGSHARQLNALGYDILGVDPCATGAPIRIDKRKLPFRDGIFDIVLSLSVMEHCFEIEDYYREAARVLKPGGIMWATFPHRWVPYDTHRKKWFRHWLWPSDGRQFNWKGKLYHIRMARKYFSLVEDGTGARLLAGTSRFNDKRGHHALRQIIDVVVKIRVLRSVISFFSSVDLWAYKLQH